MGTAEKRRSDHERHWKGEKGFLMIHQAFVLVASLIASLLFLYGWYGQQLILGNNQCKMTYSHPKKSLVKVEGWSGDYKLWKVTNADSKKLNKNPVIFVPGHWGSVDQSRSFASHMHNDDDQLQYFALDFNEEHMAIHAADILVKAEFLNKAMDAIVALYGRSGKGKDLQFGLLGHSYGGFVAKTSMLLSNHPKQCFVKLLVMLSSPNVRPPFSPDASFSKLFFEINKGWYQSYYKDKSKCPVKTVGVDRIELMPCSKCLTNVTVLSYSGGEIDAHVRPALTNIFDVSARPKNMSLIRQSSKSTGLVSISMISTVKKYVWDTGYRILSSITGLFSAKPPIPVEVSSKEKAGNFSASVPSADNISSPILIADAIDPSSPFSSITSESWFENMAAYNDPHHISVRTSQMQDVGFMVDHYAILWCYQFVAATSSAMKTILRKPMNADDDFILHKLLKLSNSESIEVFLKEPKKLGIRQLTNYIPRNETSNNFSFMVVKEEEEMRKFLNGNFLHFYATKLFINNLEKVPIGLFNVGVLSVVATLLALLFGETYVTTPASPLFTIMNILDVRPYVRLTSIAASQGKAMVGSVLNLFGVLVALLAVAMWRFQWNFSSISYCVSFLVILCVAVAVKLALSVVSLLIRLCMHLVVGFFQLIGLARLYQSVSKFFKKGVLGFICSYIPEYFSLLLIIVRLLSAGLSVSVIFETSTFFSFLIIWSFSSSVLYWLMNTAGLVSLRGANAQIRDDLLFLYMLFTMCSVPSAFFAYQHIFIPHHTMLARAGMFDAFGADRLNALLLLFIGWLFGRNIAKFSYKLKIEPMNGFRIIIEPDPKLLSKVCMHEDGGYKSIYEAVPQCTEQCQVSSDIVVGPTYKVVKCFCPTNRAFKSADEWCEWCRCPKCGYGKLIKTVNPNEDLDKPRIHLDMIIILALGFSIVYLNYWGENKIHVMFYALGALFFVFWIRLFFKKSTIILPDK